MVTPSRRQFHGVAKYNGVDTIQADRISSSSKTSLSLQVSELENYKQRGLEERRRRILGCSNWASIDAKSKAIKKDVVDNKDKCILSRDTSDTYSTCYNFERRSSFSDTLLTSRDLEGVDEGAASLLSLPSISVIEPVRRVPSPPIPSCKSPLLNSTSRIYTPQSNFPQQEDLILKEAREAVEGVLATRIWLYQRLFDSNSIHD